MGQEEIIAKRYASGLAGRVAETGGADSVRRDVHMLANLVNPRSEKHVAELSAFLSSPRADTKEKLAAAGSLLDKLGIGGTAKDFFKLLVERGRCGLLPRIDALFDEIAGGLTGEFSGTVETAMPLSDDQLERLDRAVSAAFGRAVRLRQRIEPGLLAGAKIIVGDKTIDGSVMGKWRRLRNGLAGGVAAECVRSCDARLARDAQDVTGNSQE